MSAITKEQLQQIEAAAKEVLWPVVWSEKKARKHFSEKITPEVVMELARIALASLEAKPIGAFHIADQQVGGTTDYIKDGQWPIDDGVIEVYAAPPAPVVVPDEVLARLEHEANHLTAWHHIDEHSCKVYRRDLLTLVNACRAAMIQGAEPVMTAYKFPPHVYRELVNNLRDTAVKYQGCQQLREQLSRTLQKVIQPEAPQQEVNP